MAALSGDLEMVGILYEAGAIVDQVGHVGTTATAAAAQEGHSVPL